VSLGPSAIPASGSSPSRKDDGTLPRLLYIGDVPVSSTYGGATLLFRLLQNYPADRLVVCAPVAGMESPLAGVRYVAFDARWPGLFRTRLSTAYCAWISWRLSSVPNWSRELVREFRPAAVLTISQTSGWILAWQLALREDLPLFMLAHDDHVFYRHLPSSLQPWAQRSFGEAYRYSSSRFCISESMAMQYNQRYGVPADTLLPTRDPQNPVFGEPAPQTLVAKRALTFAFAGSIYGDAGVRQLADFAAAAAGIGHRLIVYSPQHSQLREMTAGAPGLHSRPPVASAELAARLREEADCLLVTGSFDPAHRDQVSTLFPSKVADYSAIGLPLLAWAPAYASIADFSNSHTGCMELVTDPDPSALAPAMTRLASMPNLRTGLANAILRLGMEMFSPDAAWRKFSSCLRGAAAGGDAR
jgi:hypothetical protein